MSDTTAVVDIRDVRKTYIMGKTKVHALQGIGVNVCAGEMVAIMGASGSGKSTLMNIIGGLDYPTSGSYFLDGIEANKLGKNELADIRNAKIGFVFQGFNLLARTSALENVELPLLYDRTGRIKNHKKAALESLNLVGLGDRVDHHPNELSGGQQQRVFLARAIVQESAAPEFRGRVLSVFSVGMVGSAPIGAIVLGVLIEYWGALDALIPAMVLSLLLYIYGAGFTEVWRYRSDKKYD